MEVNDLWFQKFQKISIDPIKIHRTLCPILNFLGGLGAKQHDDYAKSCNAPPPLNLQINDQKDSYTLQHIRFQY